MCLGTEGQGKRILYVYVDAVRLSEMSPDKFWRNQAEGTKTKVKICFGPKGQYIDSKQQQQYIYVYIHTYIYIYTCLEAERNETH